MESQNSFRNKQEKQAQLWIYLLPVVGSIPAFWTLYRGKGTREQKKQVAYL